MARTVRNSNLETRTARSRLKSRRKPYWHSLESGRHLGYYRGANGGSWLARRYLGVGRYEECTLGVADDALDVEHGGGGLTFAEAQAKARDWFRVEAASGGDGSPVRGYTVRQAFADYLRTYSAGQTKGGGRALAATQRAANVHVLPKLGDMKVTALTASQIRDWHRALAEAPAQTRGGHRRHRVGPRSKGETAELVRKRRATANRILTVLKAALNHAYRDGRVATDDAWRRVSPFLNVDVPVIRYLTEAECLRIVNATEADFKPMVRAALLTGLRYGELTALHVADFDAGTIAVRTSKSGKHRHVVLTDEARAVFADACHGKPSNALIFTRADGEPWGSSHQIRRLAAACAAAGIKPAISFHVLRHTHGSLLAMRGVPMRVIADQLGHADTRITEKHYARLAPSYVAETIRANFPTLGIAPTSNVAPIDPKRRRA